MKTAKTVGVGAGAGAALGLVSYIRARQKAKRTGALPASKVAPKRPFKLLRRRGR
ncbi:MAG: hypothetical protein WC821_04740 [archaeon]|jgi:hypothetical protein